MSNLSCRRRRAWGLVAGSVLGGLFAARADAQFPPPPTPTGPATPPAAVAPQPYALPPLMYVRIAGPPGMKATFYRGAQRGQTVATPCVVGLRPGYGYRVGLSDVPGYAGQVFFPTLEVRASLQLTGHLRNADFPATLNFTDEDFTRARAGALIRKVVVLEQPDVAIPVASRADEPLEVRVPPTRDPLAEAQDHGQPLVLVHLGQRELTAEELAFSGVGGTVLLPGEKVLGPPRLPPTGPWACFPVVDPMNGPIGAHDYACLPDGGDVGLPAGFGPDGRLRGLDPSDTVAEYVDSHGRKRLAVSNRVCLCVPRFIVTRGEAVPAGRLALFGLGQSTLVHQPDVYAARQALISREQRVGPEVTAQKLQASGTVNRYGTAIVGRVQGLEIQTSLRAVAEVNGRCVRPEPAATELPLLIIKWPDKSGAMIGDVVTFYLRYTNQGGLPISDVVVSDSLLPRFEYVAGSAQTDREATFTLQPNETGSAVLRWQFSEVLPPRASGTIRFQVRVR